MKNEIPAALNAVVNEAFGLMKMHGGSIVGFTLEQLFKKRMDDAKEIALNELKNGDTDLSNIELEETVAIVHRYMRAAHEGAARINLRLLAQVISGQAKSKALRADEFMRYASILESLSYEEIILIGNLHKHWISRSQTRHDAHKIVVKASQKDLVPSIFESYEEWLAIAGACVRTGLITGNAAIETMLYYPTPLMDKLSKTVSFEKALKEEKAVNRAG